ncbi:hypothetical protein [Pelosinus propionicus]|uniref:Uncharacterized protein n=1 Tax=Pelosinus propionicus DSM 13327 TaxID=1123291 RepID=A0A1I4LII5_9FIRM|nr:hypothetical protein [Pelosinus propionicus]SFL90782.1 hypothetical protein SAMN04490355_10259 [Pelosinus propionicus DSM 13327]
MYQPRIQTLCGTPEELLEKLTSMALASYQSTKVLINYDKETDTEVEIDVLFDKALVTESCEDWLTDQGHDSEEWDDDGVTAFLDEYYPNQYDEIAWEVAEFYVREQLEEINLKVENLESISVFY